MAAPVKVDLSALLQRPVGAVRELALSASKDKPAASNRHSWNISGPLSGSQGNWPSGAEPATYNVWQHSEALPTVELFPMEIRTFEVELA
jgi:hypothetical protein